MFTKCSGRLFHLWIVRGMNEFLKQSFFVRGQMKDLEFVEWRDGSWWAFVAGSNRYRSDAGMATWPLTILCIIVSLAAFLLSCKLSHSRFFSPCSAWYSDATIIRHIIVSVTNGTRTLQLGVAQPPTSESMAIKWFSFSVMTMVIIIKESWWWLTTFEQNLAWRVYTTITRSIDFLYKLRSLLGALSRKKSWFAYINLVWFFSDECFLQHI